jgi:hypothetical protein
MPRISIVTVLVSGRAQSGNRALGITFLIELNAAVSIF